jgi:hypothetical protein
MSHKHGGNPNQGNPGHHTGDSPTKPLHVKLVSTEDKNKPESENLNNGGQPKQKPSKWWGISDWWVAISTGALAVFALGSFILLWIQLNDARRVFNADQRPWIEVKRNGSWVIEIGQPISYPIRFSNTGKSPAKKKSMFLPSSKKLRMVRRQG